MPVDLRDYSPSTAAACPAALPSLSRSVSAQRIGRLAFIPARRTRMDSRQMAGKPADWSTQRLIARSEASCARAKKSTNLRVASALITIAEGFAGCRRRRIRRTIAILCENTLAFGRHMTSEMRVTGQSGYRPGRGFPLLRKPFSQSDLRKVMEETTGLCDD